MVIRVMSSWATQDEDSDILILLLTVVVVLSVERKASGASSEVSSESYRAGASQLKGLNGTIKLV